MVRNRAQFEHNLARRILEWSLETLGNTGAEAGNRTRDLLLTMTTFGRSRRVRQDQEWLCDAASGEGDDQEKVPRVA